MRALVVTAALALGLAACGPVENPPVDAGPPGKFSEIYTHFFPQQTRAQCNFCHSNPPNDISNGNLSMGADKDAAYASLMGKSSTSSKCNGKAFIVPGNPDASLFLDKMLATPSCGGRMPLGGTALTDEERTLVRSWILAGAPND